MNTCPLCAQDIRDEATACRYCGADLIAPPTADLKQPPSPPIQTERQQTSEAPRDRTVDYRKLLEHMPSGVAVYEAVDGGDDFIVKEFNHSAERIEGVSREQVIGKRLSEVLPGVKGFGLLGACQRVWRTGVPEHHPAAFYQDENIVRWLENDVYRLPSGEVVIVYADITECQKAERELRWKTALFEAQMDATIDGVLIVDEHGHKILQNSRCVELWKIPEHIADDPDNARQLEFAINNRLKDPEQAVEKIRYSLAHPNETGRGEIELKDGTILDSYSAPVSGKDGTHFGKIWVFRDITEAKRAQAEKSRLDAQLWQAQKMESVGRLAGGVAHEVNNMLSVIIGNAELAREKVSLSSQGRVCVDEVLDAARRCTSVTAQLLAFARKQTISPAVLDLNKILKGTLTMLRRLIGEDITLTWRPGAHLWRARVDPSQIDQILANLCVNARDAITGSGHVTVETDNVTLDYAYCAHHVGAVPGEFVCLTVSDDGCGMDKEAVAHAFDPFFTTKDVGKGTGLGLAMVYGIVKQNNGFIDVNSEPGKGTTFALFLPRCDGTDEEIKAEGPDEVPLGHGEVVLMVEDEPAILRLGKRMLEGLGYQTLTANTPSEALRVAGEYAGRIHLLVTDIVMPEMSGREVADRLRILDPKIKTLFMSGYTADEIAIQGVLPEDVSFVQKPFHKADLASKVRAVLDSA